MSHRLSNSEDQIRLAARQEAQHIQEQQRLQQEQQRLQQEQQLQLAAEQQQQLLVAQQLEQQPVPVATPRGGAAGIIGGLVGAMRRDTSPHTSNPASRAHSLLASREGSNLGREHSNLGPQAGATGERSQVSIRSHMETCNLPRGETSAGDESMGTSSGSEEGSNRSMLPLSDSRAGSDSLRADAMAADGSAAESAAMRGTTRGDTGLPAHIAPEFALYDQTAASVLAANGGQATYGEYGAPTRDGELDIRYHPAHSRDRAVNGAQQHIPAPGQHTPPAQQQHGVFHQRTFGSGSGSGSRGNSAMSDGTGGGSGAGLGAPAESSRPAGGSKKNKHSKRRILPDLRGAQLPQFPGFGFNSGEKASR